ncbi:hypothetical protein V3I01_09730 [Sphingomonas sp. gentR]|jgi:hypothetical protein|uniref:hypothetical protein n=2 Tax=unclassified Sphingomonas TaxID=196159 RepID=UPI00177B04C2
MSDHAAMQRDVAARQIAMFSSFVGRGLHTTRAALSAASGIPESTLREWAGGATLPLSAVFTLRRHLPAQAIAMICEPGDVRLVDIETSETNWDEIASETAGLTYEICEARRDGHIDHVERAKLQHRARALGAALADIIEH